MNFNGYINKNSIIHRMNPSIKFVISIVLIVLIFIPAGFFLQTIICLITILTFFIARIPFRKFFHILLSILFMMVILFVINWITYKSPGVVFNSVNKNNSLIDWIFDSKNVFPYAYKDDPNNTYYFMKGYLWDFKDLSISETKINELLTNENIPNININNGFTILDTTIFNEDAYKKLTNILRANEYKLIYQRSDNLIFMYIYRSNWYSLSSYGIILMLYVSIKIFLMILVVTILTSTTSSVELTYAIEDILSPLRLIKVPVTVISMTISLGIRFIPSLLDESDRILKAQASRGLDFKNGKIKQKVLALISFIVPLFSIAFKKADELANAMEVRGYDPKGKRTRYREYKVNYFDVIFYLILVIVLSLVSTLMLIENKQYFYSPYGVLDAITIFGK